MCYGKLPVPMPKEMKVNLYSWQYDIFRANRLDYHTALALKEKSSEIVATTLKSLVGESCYHIYQHLPLTDEQRKDHQKILEGLTKHFEPKSNTIYERYIFNSCKQENQEAIETYMARLRKLAATCEFGAVQDGNAAWQNCYWSSRQSGYRARLSRESVLTLEKAQMMCRSAEQANLQIQNMESKKQVTHYARSNKTFENNDIIKETNCGYCGSWILAIER